MSLQSQHANAKRCLLEPIEEIFDAARILMLAAEAHVAGDTGRASDLITQADLPAISIWTEMLWGKTSPEVHKFRPVAGAPVKLPRVERIGARMPAAAVRRAIILRDGYHCRFCGIPVVDATVRRRIRLRYPDALRWGTTNREQHSAFQCMNLQFDHVVPHSRGGATTAENLVITCAPCNFGRMDWTPEEVGLLDPRSSPVSPPTWDGHSQWDGLRAFLGG